MQKLDGNVFTNASQKNYYSNSFISRRSLQIAPTSSILFMRDYVRIARLSCALYCC